MVTRFKLDRSFFIDKQSRVLAEKYDAIVYGYEYIDASGKPRFIAIAFHGKSQKPDFNFYFRTNEQRQQKIDSFLNSRKLHYDRQARKTEARKNFVNPFKVGDIFHHSWGYEQTNCDYYQCVEVKPASVVLRPIGTRTVKGSEGFMCESLMPVKDAFVFVRSHALCKDDKPVTPDNPTITKKVSFLVRDNGKLDYYIPTPCGWCNLWDGKPNYSSWYA